MAKFYGEIGYGHDVEKEPGDYELVISERILIGDVIQNSFRASDDEQVVPNIHLGNTSFSVLADAYALENVHAMKYIKWMGVRWSITNVSFEHPRLIIRPGEVYNGPKA